MKEFLRCLKNNNVDTDSFIYPVWKWTKEPLIVTSHKLIHYCKLVFQKFYSSHDFLPYRYTVHCVGMWWRLGRCFGHVLPSIEDSGFPSYFVSSSGEVSEGYAVRVVQGWAYCSQALILICSWTSLTTMWTGCVRKPLVEPVGACLPLDLPPTKVDEIFERTKSTTGKSQNVSECIRYFLLYW